MTASDAEALLLGAVALVLAGRAVESWWRRRVLRRVPTRMLVAPFETRPALELRAFEE